MVTRAGQRHRIAFPGLCLIGFLLNGCASGFPTAQGYYNEPASRSTAPDARSAAYVASIHVPWCVRLDHPSVGLDQALALRGKFYERSREAARLQPAASCWTLVQHTGARVPEAARDRELVALALPGGGSRSAVFSAAVMFELQRKELLSQVDLISSVSGGSLPASLFASSCSREGECRPQAGTRDPLRWTPDHEERVFQLLTTDFLHEVVGAMALPWNQILYRTTSHDRTDTMAEVFGARLFGGGEDAGPFGMTFRHLNPRRPNLVINAMNSTGRRLGGGLGGQHFLFTVETFEDVLRSNLHDYPLAFAVAGSGAFPGAFHPLTLAAFPEPDQGRRQPDKPERFLHVVDGGLYDRLGGEAIQRLLQDVAVRERPCAQVVDQVSAGSEADCLARVLLFLLDSGLPFEGEDDQLPDVRIPVFDLFVNHNIKMASLALLEIQAELRLQSLHAFVRAQNDGFRRRHGLLRDMVALVSIRLRDIERCVGDPLPCARAEGLPDLSRGEAAQRYEDLWERVVDVPLSLEISQESATALRRAARILVHTALEEQCPAGRAGVHCPPTLPRDRDDPLQVYTGTPPR